MCVLVSVGGGSKEKGVCVFAYVCLAEQGGGWACMSART